MNVYCLRVKRLIAGKTFPFDRVYVARSGEHAVFKKLFRYAFVLPLEGPLRNVLGTLTIDEGTTRGFARGNEWNVSTGEWRTAMTIGDWVMCVPILPKYVTENLPKYITAAGRYRQPAQGSKPHKRYGARAPASPFPNLAYLQTPTENIRPICVACSNFIAHQNGACRLGEELCYSSLSLGQGAPEEPCAVESLVPDPSDTDLCFEEE